MIAFTLSPGAPCPVPQMPLCCHIRGTGGEAEAQGGVAARVPYGEGPFIQNRGWNLGLCPWGWVFDCGAALQGRAGDSQSGLRTSDFGSWWGRGAAGCIGTIGLCVCFLGGAFCLLRDLTLPPTSEESRLQTVGQKP